MVRSCTATDFQPGAWCDNKIGRRAKRNGVFLFLHTISLLNVLLIFRLVLRLTGREVLAFVIALMYLVSPSTMTLENELFYTQFVSLLLLLATIALVKYNSSRTFSSLVTFVLLLALLCLTRSIYHLIWFLFIALLTTWHYRREPEFWGIVWSFAGGFALVVSWYFKNLIIFGIFSTSSWMGMNMARNVFHDTKNFPPNHIESIEPFSPVSSYNQFIDTSKFSKFRGLNDQDLFMEYKNGHNINENHVAYLQLSSQYMKASVTAIRKTPVSYVLNVAQSGLLFFAPATRYSLVEGQARKIRPYDVMANFNVSTFANNLKQRKVLTALSAVPMLCLYGFAMFLLYKSRKGGRLSLPQQFIIATVSFVFAITTLMEHYENMRFRFEIQPLFLILLATLIPFARSKNENPGARV